MLRFTNTHTHRQTHRESSWKAMTPSNIKHTHAHTHKHTRARIAVQTGSMSCSVHIPHLVVPELGEERISERKVVGLDARGRIMKKS